MDQFEKVEKLRERANVSYEEAREALEASNWDLLDAMVYLEKNGKAKGPAQETYSTNYEDQAQYVSVKDKVNEQKTSDGFFTKLCKLAKILWKKSKQNYFCINRKGEEVLKMPVWGMILILMFAWHLALPAVIIGLFFDCKYSFCGSDNMEQANKAMEKASEFADRVKDEAENL